MPEESNDNKVSTLPQRELGESDESSNAVESDTEADENIEKGACYGIERSPIKPVVLDIIIPIRGNSWEHIGLDYGYITDRRFTPKQLIIRTIRDMTITIVGDNLDKIFRALWRNKLIWIRQCNKKDNISDGEPKPYEITIKENE